MSQIKIADISRWQGVINWDEFRKAVDGVVIKVSGSDGGLYKDGMADRNRDEARRVGMPVWFYHYKGSGTPEEQAQYMLNAIGGLRPGEAVVCDDENEAKVNVGFNAAFADKMKELSGGLIDVVYSNLSRFQNVDLTPLRERNMAAWVAKYGVNDGTVAGAGNPPSLGDNIIINMWQYTSQARIPGVTANTVDMNIFYGTVDQFKAYGAKDNVPAPQPPAPTPAPAPVGDGYYTVTSRDSDGLAAAMARIGITDWRYVAATNGLVAPYTIYVGQRLKVFGGSAGAAVRAGGVTYLVVKNDTLIGIGTKTGHGWQQIAVLNNIAAPKYTIYPGQLLQLPAGGVTPAAAVQSTYTVTSSDYDGLAAAMRRIGRSDWQAIAQLNGLAAPYVIYPNQVLRLN